MLVAYKAIDWFLGTDKPISVSYQLQLIKKIHSIWGFTLKSSLATFNICIAIT